MTASRFDQCIGVLLVCGRADVRDGLRAVVEQEPDLCHAGEVATIHAAADVRGGNDVDVIVTDVDMPDGQRRDGVTALCALFPRSPIFVFTQIDQPAAVRSMLAAGALGYVLENASGTELLDGIRAVAQGHSYVQPSLGVALALARDATRRLSLEEEEVLRLIALGHTTGEVASVCHVSRRTAESVRARVQRKIGCRTRAELVSYAQEIGLVGLDP